MGNANDIKSLYSKFKEAFNANDLQNCVRLLTSLKLQLTQNTALAFQPEDITASKDDLLVARDVLEHAVFLGVKLQDEAVFERNFLQLKAFYAATRYALGQAPKEYLILGLNMLRLLVQNRIAEFHTELELIPPEVQQSPYLNISIQLEQWLMEGAYNKILGAKGDAPDQSYNYFLDLLSTTVRDEVASCSERAYQSVTVSSAKKLLMFKTDTEVFEYAQEHGWEVKDGRICFQNTEERKGPEIPSIQLIHNSLTYAQELERIV